MAGLLATAGCDFTDNPEVADIIIVNTCAFIAPAVREAKETLSKMSKIKASDPSKLLICAGCLPQREKEGLYSEFPELDAVIAPDHIAQIETIIRRLAKRRQTPRLEIASPEYLYDHATPRLLSTPPATAYIKIAEGCLHACSFCTIPQLRGRYRSRRPDSVVTEAEALVNLGVRELILIAQDTTAYGRDLSDGGANIASLMAALARIEGIDWLRLMYAYPGEITDELLEVFASAKNICNYIDLPLQHSAPRILKAMRRPGAGEEYLRLIEKIRSFMPEAALRSAFIVGFPGETEDEFRNLLRFLDNAQIDRVGAFPFYCEAGTTAADLPGQLPAAVVQERYETLMLRQQDIAREKNLAWIEKELDVLIENTGDDEISGRSFRDAPEIDGQVLLEPPAPEAAIQPGEFVRARITAATEYDLYGRIVSSQTTGAT